MMGALAAKDRLLVILDEWPYLAGSSRRLASVLQHVWDETLQHTRLMLVLSGSYLSIMERDILGQRAPLYGRRTGQLLLRPLGVHDAATLQAIPFWPEEVGSWWSRKAQIDLVAVQRARCSSVLGEARWRRERMSISDLDDLQARARHWLGDERGWELWYALYSRSGFSKELQTSAAGDSHLLLFTPVDVVLPGANSP